MPRKSFAATDEDRRLVKHLAAVGIAQEDISKKMNIKSPKTLRKHFRNELDLGAIEADASVRGRIYQDAHAGNVRAQELWMKYISPGRVNCQSRTSAALPSFVVSLDGSVTPTKKNGDQERIDQRQFNGENENRDEQL